jgi:2-polyprenyl-3-methyl-5-hydroxy-6-metoxy-1,4-benzoquinol methylase
MQYDPIKRSLGKVFNKSPFTRKLFYKLLDVLLLRTWHIHKEARAWAKEHKNGAKILDAGSGFGQYTFYFSGMKGKPSVTAVDVKEEQIEDCNQFFTKIGRQNAQFMVGDLTTYTNPEAYDFILCVDVMEHIEEDVKVFENFNKSLKKGGTLLVSTPSDQGGSDVHDDEEHSFIGEHVRDGYGVQDITEKLTKAGFIDIEASYVYGTPGKISWSLSMKYPIKMLGVSKLFFIILPFYYIIVMPFALLLNYFDVAFKHKSGTGLIVKAKK